jgi:hypothetical protein
MSPSYSKSTRIPVEDADRLAHVPRALALRVAEGGEGEKREARLHAEPARHPGRLDRDLGQRSRVRHLGDGRVGDEHRAAPGQAERHADHPDGPACRR